MFNYFSPWMQCHFQFLKISFLYLGIFTISWPSYTGWPAMWQRKILEIRKVLSLFMLGVYNNCISTASAYKLIFMFILLSFLAPNTKEARKDGLKRQFFFIKRGGSRFKIFHFDKKKLFTMKWDFLINFFVGGDNYKFFIFTNKKEDYRRQNKIFDRFGGIYPPYPLPPWICHWVCQQVCSLLVFFSTRLLTLIVQYR